MAEFSTAPELKRRPLCTRGAVLGLVTTLALTAACNDRDVNAPETGSTYSAPSPDIPKKGGASRLPGECDGRIEQKYTIAYGLDGKDIDLLVGVTGSEDERRAALKQYGDRVREDIQKERQQGIIGPTDWIAISGLVGFSQVKTQGEARRQAQILTANMSVVTKLPMYDTGAAYESGGNVGTLHIYTFEAQTCSTPETAPPDLRV